jgi:hypothetical protein
VTPAFAEAYRARSAAGAAEVFARFLGRPGEGFPLKDLVGEPSRVDPMEATERALQAIASDSPHVARDLRGLLPTDLSDVEPLLPVDWDAAARAVQAAA